MRLATVGRFGLAALVLAVVLSAVGELGYRGYLGARARLAEPKEDSFLLYGLGVDPEPAARAFCGKLDGLPARAVALRGGRGLAEQALELRRALRYRSRHRPAALLLRPELSGERVPSGGPASAWAAWLEGPVYYSFLYSDLLRALSRRAGWPTGTPGGTTRWLARMIDESRAAGAAPILALDEDAPDQGRAAARLLSREREVPLAAVPGGTLVARLEELRAERAGCRPEAAERPAAPASAEEQGALLHARAAPRGEDVSSAGETRASALHRR